MLASAFISPLFRRIPMSYRVPLSASLAAFSFALAVSTYAQSPAAPAPAPAAPTPAAAAPAPAPAAAPVASATGMDGLAAYYSNRLNGRKTASGQVFDQGKLTAAHQTLPFGTMVKVTNTQNNRSVVVRINDRGPTQAGRVIDLSRAAASKLGMIRAGLVPVKLEVVKEAPAKKAKM
jgi:rare lipoprotein A